MASRRRAGRIARVVARKSYRTARRMGKRRLSKVYATKMGQTAYTAVRRKRPRRRLMRGLRRMGRRIMRRRIGRRLIRRRVMRRMRRRY